MIAHSAPKRPAEHAEEALLDAILDGGFPPGSTLPGERDLANQLGVTRPTLREALQRLERDGWVTIQQGKSTLVNDFWQDGGLNVLGTLVRNGHPLPANFIPNLLEVRLHLAPAYARSAVERNATGVMQVLAKASDLEDSAEAFAAFDWRLHRGLTLASGNPVYAMILNGFTGFYEAMARLYFARSETRTASRSFYASLLAAAQEGDAEQAEHITRLVMQQSMTLWSSAH